MTTTKTQFQSGLAVAALLTSGAACADRIAGIAGIAPAAVSTTRPADAAQALRSGVVTAVGPTKVEIDGKWYRIAAGRTLLLRKGLPVPASALAKGQKLSFSLASTTPGEQALGVIHVP